MTTKQLALVELHPESNRQQFFTGDYKHSKIWTNLHHKALDLQGQGQQACPGTQLAVWRSRLLSQQHCAAATPRHQSIATEKVQSFVVNEANSSRVRQPILVALEVKTTKCSQRCARNPTPIATKQRAESKEKKGGQQLLRVCHSCTGMGEGMGGDCREETLSAGPCAIGRGEIAWDGGDLGGGGSEG